MSVWLGGLVVLIAALPRATAALAPADRTALLHATCRRFSPLALGAVIAIADHRRDPGDRRGGQLRGAGRDRASGARCSRRSRCSRSWSGSAPPTAGGCCRPWRACWSAARARDASGSGCAATCAPRSALLAVVLAVTAVLVGYAPAADSGQGPVSGRTTIGARGPRVHDRAGGRRGRTRSTSTSSTPTTAASSTARRRCGWRSSSRIAGSARSSPTCATPGPGHYVAPAAEFGAPGDWTVDRHGADLALRRGRRRARGADPVSLAAADRAAAGGRVGRGAGPWPLPGEERLARARRRHRLAHLVARALPRRRPRQRPRSERCGGELIAFSLAGRAPPLGR